MDVKKRKREMLSDQLSEDEDEDGDCKVIPIFDKHAKLHNCIFKRQKLKQVVSTTRFSAETPIERDCQI